MGTNELSITSSVCCLVGSGPMTRLVSGSISVVSVNSSGSVSVLLLLLGTLLLRVGASAVKHCCENVLRLFLQSGMSMMYVTGDICLRRYGPSHLCACILDSCLMGAPGLLHRTFQVLPSWLYCFLIRSCALTGSVWPTLASAPSCFASLLPIPKLVCQSTLNPSRSCEVCLKVPLLDDRRQSRMAKKPVPALGTSLWAINNACAGIGNFSVGN